MFFDIRVEELVFRLNEAFKQGLVNLTLLVLAKLLRWRFTAVEDARVADLEDDIQEDEKSKQATGCIEKERRAEEKSPDNQGNEGQELHTSNDHDEACNRVLRADVLVVASDELFLALAERCNQTAEEGHNQEWEWNDSNIINGEEHASRSIIVGFPFIWTATDAKTVIDI